jgi:hypothetical protein
VAGSRNDFGLQTYRTRAIRKPVRGALAVVVVFSPRADRWNAEKLEQFFAEAGIVGGYEFVRAHLPKSGAGLDHRQSRSHARSRIVTPVDVRDLAAFYMTLVEGNRSGVYNAVGRSTTIPSREFYEMTRRTLNPQARLVWWPAVPEARRTKPRFAISPEIELKVLAESKRAP